MRPDVAARFGILAGQLTRATRSDLAAEVVALRELVEAELAARNTIRLDQDDVGRRVDVAFSDAAAPAIGRLIRDLWRSPAERRWIRLGQLLRILPRTDGA